MSGFFEEPTHFEYLVRDAVPELIRSYGYGVRKELMVWSVWCLSGEEPYTLAMVLSEFALRFPGLGFRFMILATDASTNTLDTARRGIYNEDHISHVPMHLRKKYLMRSRDNSRRLIRIAPEIREMVRFRKTDLREEDFNFREPMDIIFCRNVAGWDDMRERVDLLRRFYRHLSPGGYLFLGHDEDPGDLDVPLIPVAPMIFRKP